MQRSFRTRNCQVYCSAVFYLISTEDTGRVEPIFQVNISCCRFEILRHQHDVAYLSNINPRVSFPVYVSFLFFFFRLKI